MNEALTALLLGHVPLADLITDRVHWGRQPAHAKGFPYLNLTRVFAPRDYHMRGETDLRKTRVQIDIWAETFGAADAVQDTLASVLSGFRGSLEGVSFQGIFIVGSRDLTDQTTGGERQLFRISVDYQISWNKET